MIGVYEEQFNPTSPLHLQFHYNTHVAPVSTLGLLAEDNLRNLSSGKVQVGDYNDKGQRSA